MHLRNTLAFAVLASGFLTACGLPSTARREPTWKKDHDDCGTYTHLLAASLGAYGLFWLWNVVALAFPVCSYC
jgi:hypothetical protein